MFFSLLLYCIAQSLPFFYKINFPFYLLILSAFFCFLSIIFRFSGLIVSFVIFFVIFYFVIIKQGYSFFEALWLEGCLISSCMSLLILLLGLDNLIEKKRIQIFESEKKINQLQKENNKYLKDIQELKFANTKAADFSLALEEKNQRDIEILNHVLEEKMILKQQVSLLLDQKSFWISNYDNLHQKFLTSGQFNEQIYNELTFDLEKSKEDFYLLQHQYNKLKESLIFLSSQHKKLLKTLDNKELSLEKDSFKTSLDLTQMTSELSHIQSLYDQLRSQFEDKKFQLDITRKQLFKLEETIAIQKRDQELFLLEDNVDFTAILNLEEKLSNLEQEVIYLEELISHILLK